MWSHTMWKEPYTLWHRSVASTRRVVCIQAFGIFKLVLLDKIGKHFQWSLTASFTTENQSSWKLIPFLLGFGLFSGAFSCLALRVAFESLPGWSPLRFSSVVKWFGGPQWWQDGDWKWESGCIYIYIVILWFAKPLKQWANHLFSFMKGPLLTFTNSTGFPVFKPDHPQKLNIPSSFHLWGHHGGKPMPKHWWAQHSWNAWEDKNQSRFRSSQNCHLVAHQTWRMTDMIATSLDNMVRYQFEATTGEPWSHTCFFP